MPVKKLDSHGKRKLYKCPYPMCQVNNNHMHEKFQIGFLIWGILILANSPEKLALPIFLFCAPIFVDTWFVKAECTKVYVLKIALLFLSGIFISLYFLYTSHILIETADSFMFNSKNAILGFLSMYPISKSFICYCMIPLLISPALSWIGSASSYVRDLSDIKDSFNSAQTIT